jgi:glycosyltransferase involved in cell wall biosynthesis
MDLLIMTNQDSLHTPSPLLSIVIPTKKSRLDITVEQAIQSGLDIPGITVEVIVHVDKDCESCELDVKQKFPQPNVRYIEYPTPLPMTDNWELAVSYACGEFVCICGDDDSMLPETGTLVQWMHKNNVDNVINTQKAVYYWPSYANKKVAGTIRTLRCSGSFHYLDPKAVALENSYGPKMNFYERQPEIYTGIIKRTVLVAMKQQTGKLFGSVIPDLYFAFAVVPFIKKFGIVDYPFVLGGHSGKANASRFVKNVMKEQEDQYRTYAWSDILPNVKDFISFYADSKLKAYSDSDQQHLIKNIDIPLAFANCLYNKPRSLAKWKTLLQQYAVSLQKRRVSVVKGYLLLALNIMRVGAERLNLKMPPALHLVNRKNNHIFKYKPFFKQRAETIHNAVDLLKTALPQKGIMLP